MAVSSRRGARGRSRGSVTRGGRATTSPKPRAIARAVRTAGVRLPPSPGAIVRSERFTAASAASRTRAARSAVPCSSTWPTPPTAGGACGALATASSPSAWRTSSKPPASAVMCVKAPPCADASNGIVFGVARGATRSGSRDSASSTPAIE